MKQLFQMKQVVFQLLDKLLKKIINQKKKIILNETVINNSIEINYSEVIINENPIVNNIVRVQVGFDAYDLDNDSYVDYIEWIVPHLSNQTYDIIYITKAEHLDENRTFIEDISDEVKYLDGNWSKPINDSEYVRVTFEIPLDNTRDITVFARSACLSGEGFVMINDTQVPCEIYQKRKRIEEIRRELG